MAKLILRVYRLDDASVKMSLGINNFKDVKASDWYYGYVNVAADMKMINGYSDGTFRPNDKVTYSEAVTMIVRALGYTDLQAKPGEKWDAPYIKKMNEIRLAKNVGYFKNSDEATRGNIAIMIWNMLNAESYMTIKDKTHVGLIKETVPKKVITRYYPDYAIIDDDILEGISVYKDIVEEEEIVEYYISTKEIDDVQVPNPIPLKRIGAKLSGIYNIETKLAIGLNFIYDERFDEGTTKELEEIYKFNPKNGSYVLGKSKNYAYIYFDEEDKIDRVAYLGSNLNILVKEAKIQREKHKEIGEDGKEHDVDGKEYVLINEKNMLFTDKVLLNANGESLSWSDVKEGGVLSSIRNGMYVYNDKTVRGELESVKSKDSKIFLTVDGQLYVCDSSVTYKLYGSETTKRVTVKALQEFVGRDIELVTSYSKEVMQINLERNYDNASQAIRFGIILDAYKNEGEEETTELEISTSNGIKTFTVDKTIFDKKIDAGTLIHFESSGSEIEFIDIFVDNLKIPGGTLDMDIENKKYEDLKLDEYEIDENTVIYIIEKEYVINSDKNIKDYNLVVEKDRDILENLDDNVVHVLYDDSNVAVAIFVEKELNKYDYKYARVLDIYQEREGKKDDKNTEEDESKETTNKMVLKVKLSPFNNVISEYIVTGNINCEPGDLISYTTKDDKLEVEERYNAKLLGDKRDYIVERFEDDIIYLSNGDTININKNAFDIEGKTYLFDKYIVVFAKVSKSSGDWKFITSNIIEPRKIEVKAGDRIAIDEIEDLFVIYRGYTD